MVITYSGRSEPSAAAIAYAGGGAITLNRGDDGDVNWGRESANTDLNPDITNATNKRLMREIFKRSGVPMPDLYTLEEAEDIARDGDLMLGRPDRHTKRRGMWFVSSPEDYAAAMRGTNRRMPATHFMRWMNEAVHEYRVHVFLSRSIRMCTTPDRVSRSSSVSTRASSNTKT